MGDTDGRLPLLDPRDNVLIARERIACGETILIDGAPSASAMRIVKYGAPLDNLRPLKLGDASVAGRALLVGHGACRRGALRLLRRTGPSGIRADLQILRADRPRLPSRRL